MRSGQMNNLKKIVPWPRLKKVYFQYDKLNEVFVLCSRDKRGIDCKTRLKQLF